MDSNQELKSLKRGLRAMVLINRQGSLTISELSRALELPRTTAERVLMTLLAEGFCDRDPQTKRYYLNMRVRALSHGYTDESWITHVAAPLLFKTTREIGWPLFIATPLGEYMSLRLTTDPATSLNLHRRHIGSEIAMAVSSSGLVHLAFLEAEQRRIMLEILRQSEDPEQAPARDEQRMEFTLDKIRNNGFGFGFDLGRERSIAVPIMADGHIKAVLLMAFMSRAMDNAKAAHTFAPRLMEMATTIERLAFGNKAQEILTI